MKTYQPTKHYIRNKPRVKKEFCALAEYLLTTFSKMAPTDLLSRQITELVAFVCIVHHL